MHFYETHDLLRAHLRDFVDAAQERALAAIDGDRSTGEILQRAAITDEEGRQLFKRLWEHDLIVFGAKRPP